MQADNGTPIPWRRVHVIGLALAVLVAPVAPVGAATAPTAGAGAPAAVGGGTAAALAGFPPAPWVNGSDTSHDPATTTSLSVAYNATGRVGSASDVAVELYDATDGSFVTANASLTTTDGSAVLTVPAGTFTGDRSVTYKLNDTSSESVLATDTSLLLSSSGGGGSGGLAPAPWVNNSDTSHDPATTTSLSVAYNATGRVGSASDVAVQLLDASDGSVVAANASLATTEGLAALAVPGGSFSGDQSVIYRLRNASDTTTLATDSSTLLDGSGGGGDGGTARITIDSVSLSSTTVAPGTGVDVDVTLNNTGGASGSTTVEVFDVGTTESINTLASRSVSVGADTTKTTTLTVSRSEAGLADLYVVGGTGFERQTLLVQPSNSLSVTGYSLSATTIEQNEDLDVTATVSNGGSTDDWVLVPLYQDGVVVQTKNVTVPAGGTKQVTITTTFATAGSHTVAVGGQSPTGVTVETRGSPSVVDSSVRVVGGTQPSGDVIVGTTVSNGKLDVRLKAQGVQNGEADLANGGADDTTRFEVETEMKNFTPRMMMGTGGNVSWSVGPGSTADTANLTLYIEPRENQRFYYQDGTQPTYSNWPAENKQATTMREAQALVSFYNMGRAPVRFRTTLTGGTIVTDAQSFSPPMYRQGSNTQKPRLTVQVAGPHLTVDGSQNQGYYEALIPDGMLEQWGVTSAGQLRAAYGGSQTQATFTETPKGIKLQLDTHYSAETAEIRPAAVDSTAPAADAGSDHTVTAGDSVTFDASATTDNVGITQYEWDFEGDGTYDTTTTSTTTTHTYATAGSVTARLRVTDGAGNTDTDTVRVTVEAESGGGSNGGGSNGGGGGGGVGVADATGPSVDVSGDARSASIDVTGASEDAAVDVAFASPPGDAGVTLDAMSVTAGGDFDLSLNVAADASSLPGGPADLPSLPGDGDGGGNGDGESAAVSYLSIEHPSLDDDDISGATFDVSVETTALDERGVTPEDVAVYRHHGGEWTALDARLVGSTDDAHRYTVDSPGLSVFAVAVRAPAFDVTGASASRTDPAVGDATTVTATVENVGTAAGTHTVELRVDDETRATRTVTLDAGASTTVSFTVAPDATGTYALRVDGASAGPVTVEEADPTATPAATPTTRETPAPTATDAAATAASDTSAPGFGAVAVLAALLVTGLLARRRD
jgi:PGF-CTERM protein